MPDEKEISDLLAKLKDVNQPDEVRQWALARLLMYNKEVQAFLRNDFKGSLPESEAMLAEVNKAYDQLRPQLNKAEPTTGSTPKIRGHISLYRWSAAAAAILLVIGSYWLYRYQGQTQQTAATVAHIPAPPNALQPQQFDTIRNTGLITATHHLRDGSIVELNPGSSIVFGNAYPAITKKIFLEGSARFTVHKGSNKPFTVFVNGIEVVDMGTIFSITTKESLVKVRLIKGKVCIHSANPRISMQDIPLKPGEEFMIDTATAQYSVNAASHQQWMAPGKPDQKLFFKNTSLATVFDRLGRQSGLSIHFNKADIQDMAFTGTVDAGSQTVTIITRICLLNDLHYELKNNTIRIHK